MVTPAELCECGAVGVHPYPIGGGWAKACNECREASEQTWCTHGDADDGIAPEQWNAWADDCTVGGPLWSRERESRRPKP